MHARFQVPPEDEGGVQVLGLGESMGHAWSEIYLGGLIDGKFPQRLPQNIFLPEATLETLGVRTLERARMNAAYHFYRLLLSAPKRHAHLPGERGRPARGAVSVPGRAHAAQESRLDQPWNRKDNGHPVQPQDRGQPQRPGAGEGDQPRGRPSTGCRNSWTRTSKACPAYDRRSDYQAADAGSRGLPQTKREFSVTELDAYLNCPYDYYVTRSSASSLSRK